MRKAFSLIEIITALAIMVVATAMLAKPVRSITKDMMRNNADFQTNVSLLDMLRHMQDDVEGAEELSVHPGDENRPEDILLIKLADIAVTYQFIDESVIRQQVNFNENDTDDGYNAWKLPHAQIDWKILKQNELSWAVEISTSIDRGVDGQLKSKFRNSHIYFASLAAWRTHE